MDVGVQVSEQQRIFEALEESEARFRLLADGAPVGIFQTDARGRCRFVNRRWRDLTGQELEQAHGGGWARAVHPDDRERVVAAWNEAARLGDEFALECRVLHTGGHSHWVFARGCPVTDADGRLKGYVGTVTAIDEVKRAEVALERSERRYRHLVESSLGLICTHDFEGRLLSVNPAAATALGYAADELVGRDLRELLAPSVRDRFTDYLRTIRGQGEVTGWMRIRTRSGEERLWAYRNSVYEEEGEPLHVLGHAHDITELHRAEKAGRLLAIQDEVTGLLNRRGFETVLENRLVQAAEQGTAVELVLINPDDFEVVNDRFGRETGDRALEEIARVLARFESEAAAVCRYGGAVFTLLRELDGLDPQESLRRIEEVRASLGRREYLDGTVRFAFSAGVARLDPSHEGLSDDSALQLVRRTDEALQQAKMDGGGCTVVWTPEVETEQSGFRDRLSGIFTANLAKDYRNMLLLWDTVTVVARNPDFEELTEKVLEGLRASFKPERVALFATREATTPRLVQGLSREAESWDLEPEELGLIEKAGQQRVIQHTLGPLTPKSGGSGAVPETDQVGEPEADRRVCFAIPLVARGKCLGCLYLDGRTDRMSLDASDRVFLEALADRLAVAFARAERVEQDRRRQAAERRRLREEIDGLSQALQRAKLVVRSPEMEAVLDQARRVAPTDATVLIHGPSGTGKEVLARTLHELSPRRRNPPVVVDCTAIAPSLIESELFGHERGAFTGADQRRSGRLAEAEGSSLILDEIGELPLSVQSKLLRFVQDQELMTVGGRRVHKVDTRVIALTHRDLAAEVAAGRFREDLFHRLNVVRLTVPPLADRPDDILGLARHFITTFSSQHRKEIRGLAEETEAALLQHPWPGNVRELQNRILRAVILHEEGWLLPEDLGLGPDPVSGDEQAETALEKDPSKTAHPETGAPASCEPPEGSSSETGAWSHLREALAAQVETTLADGVERRSPLGRWIAEDLVLEAMEAAESQRVAAASLGIPETTFRRRLSKARTEVESGRAVRSPTWGRVRRALRELIHGADDASTADGAQELPDHVRSETALPERVRLLLLHEVEERVEGSPRRGATLMGVTEPTYRRWLSRD